MEKVVLIDENNRQIGTADKATIHTQNTPLHRGFSLFLFNSKNELLLTQRALSKKTFPGIWTNTVCGHPGPGESVVEAARRRLNDELRIANKQSFSSNSELIKIEEVAPYRYKFADENGILENEICPILLAYSDEEPEPNPEEIADFQWIPWPDFLEKIMENPSQYSPWSVEEAKILEKIL